MFLTPSSYRVVNTFHLGYENQSLFAAQKNNSLFILRNIKMQFAQNVEFWNVKTGSTHSDSYVLSDRSVG
jgi:hypothetical protein